MSLARFALAQAGQALIRAMSKTTHEGKGCACIAYLCTIVRICPTLLPSCELCSWLAFAALGTLPTAPLLGGTFSAAAAVRVASFPCGRSKFGFRFRNATFETRFLRFTRHAHTEKEAMLAASTPASLGHQRSKCDFDWASAAITVEDVHCRHTKGSNSQHSLPGVGGRGRSPLYIMKSINSIVSIKYMKLNMKYCNPLKAWPFTFAFRTQGCTQGCSR